MPDSSAFYSGVAQAGASIAGLAVAFILARIVTISATRKGLQNTLRDFDQKEGQIIERSLEWLLDHQYQDGSWNGNATATTHAVSALRTLAQFGEADRVKVAIEYGLKWLQYRGESGKVKGSESNYGGESGEVIHTSEVISTPAEFARERKQISVELARQYLPKSAIWGLAALGLLLTLGVLLPLTMMLIPGAGCVLALRTTFTLFILGILAVCFYIAKNVF